MSKTQPTIRIPMTLVPCDGVRVLAGHHAGELPDDVVVVLEKQTATDFTLHVSPVSTAEQSLRSFLTNDQAEQCELITGIRTAMTKPPRRRKQTVTTKEPNQ